MLQVRNILFASEYVRRIWKEKLLLKRKRTPSGSFAPEQHLQVDIVSLLQYTCRTKKMEN